MRPSEVSPGTEVVVCAVLEDGVSMKEIGRGRVWATSARAESVDVTRLGSTYRSTQATGVLTTELRVMPDHPAGVEIITMKEAS